MGTKENPGQIDCYGAAAPDEPIFVLKATDELAPIVIRVWAELYKGLKGEMTEKQARKFSEAYTCAAAMERYRKAQERPFNRTITSTTDGAIPSKNKG